MTAKHVTSQPSSNQLLRDLAGGTLFFFCANATAILAFYKLPFTRELMIAIPRIHCSRQRGIIVTTRRTRRERHGEYLCTNTFRFPFAPSLTSSRLLSGAIIDFEFLRFTRCLPSARSAKTREIENGAKSA